MRPCVVSVAAAAIHGVRIDVDSLSQCLHRATGRRLQPSLSSPQANRRFGRACPIDLPNLYLWLAVGTIWLPVGPEVLELAFA